MTCKNCGKELLHDAEFCENCETKLENAAPVEQEAQNNEAPAEVLTEAPVEEAPAEAAAESTVGQEPEKKSKKGLFIGIGVAVILIAIIAVAFPFIKNFFSKTFTPDDVYYKNAERASVEKAVNTIALALDEYDKMVIKDSQSLADFYDSKELKMNVSLDFGDGVVNYLSESAEMELSFLKNIDLGFDFALKGDNAGLGLALGLENKNLISADVLIGLKDFITYVTVPELSQTAMKLDLEALTGEDISGLFESEEFATSWKKTMSMYSALPESKTLKSVVMRYLDLVLEQVKTVEKSNAEIVIGSTKNNCTAFTTTFTPDDLEALNVALLTELKDDEEIWEAYEKLVTAIALDSEEASLHLEARKELNENFDSIIADIDGTFDEIGNVKYTAYIDSTGNIVGRTLAYGDGSVYEFNCTADGSAMEFEVIDAGFEIVKLVMESTVKNGVGIGNAVLSVEGKDVLNAAYENVKADGTATKITLTPTEEITANLSAEEFEAETGIDLGAMGIDLTKLSFVLSFETDLDVEKLIGNVKYTMDVLSNGESVICVGVDADYNEANELVAPESFEIVSDENGIINWLSTADIFGFLSTLPEGLSNIITSIMLSDLA